MKTELAGVAERNDKALGYKPVNRGKQSLFLLRMPSHLMRSVRTAPPFDAVRGNAKLSLSLTKRGEAGRRTERSGRSASERMFAEPKRSEVEKPWCRSRATSCEAVRSAPCSWAQNAFERSKVLRRWFSERSPAAGHGGESLAGNRHTSNVQCAGELPSGFYLPL